MQDLLDLWFDKMEKAEGGPSNETLGYYRSHVRWVLVVAYGGWAVLSAAIHLARRDAGRAGCVAVPTVAAALVVLFAGDLAAEGVVWVLAGGVLVALAANARSER